MPTPFAPKLLSSINGAIGDMLFCVPDWVFQAHRYSGPDRVSIEGYADILRGMMGAATERMRFTLLTHRSAGRSLERWLSENQLAGKARVLLAPDDIRFTLWAADCCLVCTDESGANTRCLQPRLFPRMDDGRVAELLAASGLAALGRSPLFFQGGNVLVGDDFWFIGADDVRRSLELEFFERRPGESEAAAIDRALRSCLDAGRTAHPIAARVPVFEEARRAVVIDGEPWEEILYYGSHPGTVQPAFHIDLFISLMGRMDDGRFKVLVGDPGMAADLTGLRGGADPMQAAFDDIAAQLGDLGFAVERNPLPLVYYDDPRERLRRWYFASSNNVIVQDAPPIVWMPSYGHHPWPELAHTDAVNRAIWRRHGYDVRMLPNFHSLAARHGGPHCLSKCLARHASAVFPDKYRQ